MKKEFMDLIGSILLYALIFSCLSLVIPLASARSSFSLGSKWNFTEAEQEKDSAVAKFIATLAVLRRWERATNYYGSGTTLSATCLCAYGYGDTYAISFYFGHGLLDQSYGNRYHYYMTDNDGVHIYDFVLYPYTFQRRTRFALIWSCYQAHEIGGVYDSTIYGPHGMPNAWLRITDGNASPDGYINPDGSGYAFIGWTLPAPLLTDVQFGADSYNFLLNFYASALYSQKTLHDSLDDATANTWHVINKFSQSPFYNGIASPAGVTKLVLYGDGSLWLL